MRPRRAKRRGQYLEAIDRLQSAGVTVNGCFILGLDSVDSLSALRVAAGVEREFGVTIPDDTLHKLATLQAMLDYVRRQ